MDCATFERRLAELLGGELDEAGRARGLAALREHAGACPECGGSRDLLALMAEPAGRRDLVDEPGAEYWNGFERRVRERLGRLETPRRRSPWWLTAAAAALLLVAVAGWRTLGPREDPPELAGKLGEGAAPVGPPEPVPFPEPLERQLAAATTGDLLSYVETLAGWGDAWDARVGAEEVDNLDTGGLFPDLSGLDDETQQALLHWLKEQTS